MAKAVFVHRPDSIYDDFPEERYQFPKMYLSRVKACEGDWIIYYEPRGGGGRLGYNAIAKVQEIVEDPSAQGLFFAVIEARSYLPLTNFVPFRGDTGYFETALAGVDGKLNTGRSRSAVRPISDSDFSRILQAGFRDDVDVLPRVDILSNGETLPGLHDEQSPFGEDPERIRVEQTISRINRDRVFRRQVLDAYDSTCAITGLRLINGGGRAEVEAAHIKPVQRNGPDVVRNGLALSGTVHWMFDRGLISLSDDAEILISRQMNDPGQVMGLINQSRRAEFPENSKWRPHPAYLSWHRENCFKH